LRSTYQNSFGKSYHNEYVRWHCVVATCLFGDLRNPPRVQRQGLSMLHSSLIRSVQSKWARNAAPTLLGVQSTAIESFQACGSTATVSKRAKAQLQPLGGPNPWTRYQRRACLAVTVWFGNQGIGLPAQYSWRMARTCDTPPVQAYKQLLQDCGIRIPLSLM
jgi:hypothetical protein